MIENYKTILLIAVLLLASAFDLKRGIIPNILIVPAIIAAIVLNAVDSWILVIINFASAFAIISPILWFFHRKVVGGGDIKLLFFVGIIYGFQDAFALILASFILVAMYMIENKITYIRYAPFLTVSVLFSLVLEFLSPAIIKTILWEY